MNTSVPHPSQPARRPQLAQARSAPTRAPRLTTLACALAALLLSACATGPGLSGAPGAEPSTAPSSVAPGSATQASAGQRPVVLGAPASAQAAAAPAESEMLTVDPLDPTVRVDLNARSAHDDLWGRVRQGFQLPDLDTEHVRKWEQWYAARPDYVARMTERGGRYMFHIVEELNRRKMPAELALLPFIESAYNPQAMSVAKASGMWQFIPGTGRDYALKQNIFRDDRRDVLASTRAALDYLQSLHTMFGDWHLALAAYNWGQGNVQKAINRNAAAGLPTGYTDLRMPDETRNYVPKLQAVKNIISRPEAFNLALTPLKNHPYFISVGLDRDIDVERAAKLAGLPMDEFKALNPQMNKPVILAAGTPQVLLPYDNANQFVRALRQHKGPLASWTAWVAPKTTKPAQVAEQFGMDEAELRRINNIPPRMLVKAGSTLLVARAAHRQADVDESVADNASLALAPDLPPVKKVSFRTGKRGDTVAAVARRYGVSPAQVLAWNPQAHRGRFGPGQVVSVQVRVRQGGSTALAHAGKANAEHRAGRAHADRVAKAEPRSAGGRKSGSVHAKATAQDKAGLRHAKASGGKTVVAGGTSRKLVKPGPTARSRSTGH